VNFISHTAYISSAAIKKCRNEKSFFHLVQQLKILENSIQLTTDNGDITVHMVLGLLVGDNLAVNGINGFVQSYNSKIYCRACTKPIEKKKQKY